MDGTTAAEKPNRDEETSRKNSEREKRENGDRHRRRRHSSSSSDNDRSHRHRRSHKGSERRSKRSRSRDRPHRHSSRSSRDRHSSHRSRHHRSARSPPRRKSRSPRPKSRSSSPPPVYNRALDAQERLARRLEKARQLMKRKEELAKREERSTSEKLQQAVKKATDVVNGSTVNISYEGMSAKATAQVEALRAKAFAETGIEVPSYYNPLAINPLNYAQQAAKRKKLWAKKEDTDSVDEKAAASVTSEKSALWSGVKFGDEKSNEKFAKLMGIKADQAKDGASKASQDIVKKQAEVFQNLDMQYQQARLTTHTQRGVGLGFSSTYIDPNMPGVPK